MAIRKDSPVQRLAFEKVRRASAQYGVNLRKVATHIDHLVKMFDPNDPVDMGNLRMLLYRYSQALSPWARKVAEKTLQDIGRRDTKAWQQYARQMGRAIHQELEQADTGKVYSEAMARQVHLITSLPTEAANRVHELVTGALGSGKRPSEIAEMIMQTGEVTKSRATLIARTEVARAASEFTQARAVSVGSTHYIWRGVRDRRERDSHWEMEGRVCEWANPPEVEPGKRYHAGCIYNCRCYPEPVIPED